MREAGVPRQGSLAAWVCIELLPSAATLTVCAAPASQLLEVDADALVIVAFTDEMGHAIALETGRGGLETLELGRARAGVVWTLSPSDFLLPDGSRPSSLEGLDVRLASRPPRVGSCSGCTVPDHPLAPGLRTMHAGSRCPPLEAPALVVEHDLGRTPTLLEDAVERARLSVAVTWPGECAVEEAPTGDSRTGFEFCPVAPVDSPHPFRKAALEPTGRILAAGEHSMIWIEPDGRVISATLHESSQAIAGITHWPGAGSTSFLVAFHDPELPDEVRFERVSVTGSALARQPLDQFADVRPSRFLHTADGLHMSGHIAQQTDPIGFTRCGLDGTCRRQDFAVTPTCSFAGRKDEIIELLELDEWLVAVNEMGGLAIRPKAPTSAPWTCAHEGPDVVRTQRSRLTVLEVIAARGLGGRIQLCGQALDDDSTLPIAFVGSLAPFDASLTLTATGAGRCEALLATPEGSLAAFQTRAVWLDQAGRRTHDQPLALGSNALFPSLEAARVELRAYGDKLLATSTDQRTIWSGSTGGLSRVYGPPHPVDGAYAELVRDAGRVLVFSGGAVPLELTPGTDCPSIGLRSLNLPAIPNEWTVTEAERELGMSDAFLIAANSPDGARVVRARADGLDALELPRSDDQVLGMAQLSPGIAVVTRKSGALEWVSSPGALGEAEVRELEVSYDDPSTPSVEDSPSERPTNPKFSAIAASHGVAWAVGEERIARITLSENRVPVARATWFRLVAKLTEREGQESPPNVAALEVVSPSRLLVGVDVDKSTIDQTDRVAVFELVPEGVPCRADSPMESTVSGIKACRVPEQRASLNRPSHVRALFWNGHRRGLVSFNGEVSQDGGRPFRTGHDVSSAEIDESGVMFFGGPAGLVTAGIPKD
ncbi:MAG: hypothetical protein HYV07_14430 [Deltaproteobacteria bacterium]|nr:hypothetical protein [Deltaproteobacteria bacterium]